MYRDQCEELRSVETKHRHGEIAKQRSEQIRLKDETQKRLIEGIIKCDTLTLSLNFSVFL